MVISEKYKEYMVEHYPNDLNLNERARYDFKNGYGGKCDTWQNQLWVGGCSPRIQG